jgi:hypothetical protein
LEPTCILWHFSTPYWSFFWFVLLLIKLFIMAELSPHELGLKTLKIVAFGENWSHFEITFTPA